MGNHGKEKKSVTQEMMINSIAEWCIVMELFNSYSASHDN